MTPVVDAVCDCLVPVPPPLDAGGEGFEVWETFKEGATRFLTFGRWLDHLIETQWVARHDALLRRLAPAAADQLTAIGRYGADPDYHWYAVRLVCRLGAAPAEDGVLATLDRLGDGDDPYLRLAAAQADLIHRPDRARRLLAALAGAAEPTVALGRPRRPSEPVTTRRLGAPGTPTRSRRPRRDAERSADLVEAGAGNRVDVDEERFVNESRRRRPRPGGSSV